MIRWRKAANAEEKGSKSMYFDTTGGLNKLHYYWSGIDDVVGFTEENASSEDRTE